MWQSVPNYLSSYAYFITSQQQIHQHMQQASFDPKDHFAAGKMQKKIKNYPNLSHKQMHADRNQAGYGTES